MGRQSFLEENQKFQKMHFYHLSPSCVYIHQNGTQRHQLVSYENTYHCGSFWGYLTGKNSFLAQNLSQKYNRKRPKLGKPRQALFRAHFIVQIAIGGSQFIPYVHKNDGYGQ